MKYRHIVVGYAGEVGNSVYQFLKSSKNTVDVHGIDISKADNRYPKGHFNTLMHICIPYTDKFIQIVKNYIDTYKPYATIIYSTVPPGTTRKVGTNVFHSPLEGRHPHLLGAFKLFPRFLGMGLYDMGVPRDIETFFKRNGLKVISSKSDVTELAKILSTTRYGIYLMFADEMDKICEKFGVDFNNTVIKYQEEYNKLYNKLNIPVIQPVLTPPKGFIGGHCVVSNAKFLAKYSKLIKKLSEYNKT